MFIPVRARACVCFYVWMLYAYVHVCIQNICAHVDIGAEVEQMYVCAKIYVCISTACMYMHRCMYLCMCLQGRFLFMSVGENHMCGHTCMYVFMHGYVYVYLCL